MKLGVHEIAPEAYYADRLDDEVSLNGTVLKALITDSPLHAWTQHPRLNPGYEEKTSDAFDLGTAVHALFLQGELVTEEMTSFTYDEKAVATALLVSVDGKPFALVADEKEWRSNAAKAVRTEARARRLVALKIADWNRTRDVARVIRGQIPDLDTGALPPMFVAGRAERVLVWRDRGVLCRARLDWLHDTGECVDDAKTTGQTANPHVWARRTMFSIGADIQAAFTLRGLRAALGVESTFRFLIAETKPPYAISAVTPSAMTLSAANRRIDVALDRWKRCLADDAWPSFPTNVIEIDPPAWAEMDWLQDQEAEAAVA